MTLTSQWQHSILLVGFFIPIFFFWVPYSKSGDDRYGIGGMIVAAGTLIVWMFALCVYFGLGYFGVFT